MRPPLLRTALLLAATLLLTPPAAAESDAERDARCTLSTDCTLRGLCIASETSPSCVPVATGSTESLRRMLNAFRDGAPNRCREATIPRTDRECLLTPGCWSFGDCAYRAGACKPWQENLEEYRRLTHAISGLLSDRCTLTGPPALSAPPRDDPPEPPVVDPEAAVHDAVIAGYQTTITELRRQLAETVAERDDLRARLEAMMTPEVLLERAELELANKRYGVAIEYATVFNDRYPGHRHAKRFEKVVARANDAARRDAAISAARASAAAAFDALVEPDARLPTVKVSGSALKRTDEFIRDRYGDEYRYETAERGRTYLLAQVTVTADEGVHDPRLPGLFFYRLRDDGKLEQLGRADVQFERWEDFGSYLGNTPDDGNDFAKSQYVRFDLGLDVRADDARGVIALVAQNRDCYSRVHRAFGKPPIAYRPTSCPAAPRTLTAASFIGTDRRHHLLAIAALP